MCDGDRLGAAGGTELRHRPGQVHAHGLLGDEQPLADRPVGQPVRDQLQHRVLARGERGTTTAAAGRRTGPGTAVAGPHPQRGDGLGQRAGAEPVGLGRGDRQVLGGGAAVGLAVGAGATTVRPSEQGLGPPPPASAAR